MPFRSFRAAIGVALPCLINCQGITQLVSDGDEIEADFETGIVKNLTTNGSENYPALAPEIKAIIEEGGMRGMLAAWLRDHPELAEPAVQ